MKSSETMEAVRMWYKSVKWMDYNATDGEIMAVRKSAEETIVVLGERDEWLTRCAKGLIGSGFKEVETNTTLGQVTGKYRTFPTHGEIQVTVTPAIDGHAQLVLRSTANVDNIYALFASPNKKILTTAKESFT